MGINASQLRELIIIPTLTYLHPEIPFSESAVNLLLGTCAQESHMGEYLAQLGGGPALGIYQMEPSTWEDIYQNFLLYKPKLGIKVDDLAASGPLNKQTQLISNLAYATAMARVHYFRVNEPLPSDPLSVFALGAYWKSHYNTSKGKGRVQDFCENYHRLVLEKV